jgi:pectate lyase
VTYHRNWFDGTNQRSPRVRFGNPVHVYNNYYGGVGDYGVASTMEGCVIVEGNYFENTDDPFHRGEGDSPAGSSPATTTSSTPVAGTPAAASRTRTQWTPPAVSSPA